MLRAFTIILLVTALLSACAEGEAEGRGSFATTGHLESVNAEGRWFFWWGAVSPDGSRLAFRGLRPNGQAAVGIDDQRGFDSITDHTVRPVGFAWMPMSDSVVIADRPNSDAQSTGSGGDRLIVVDLEGTVLDELTIDEPLRFTEGFVIDPTGSFLIAGAEVAGQSNGYTDLVRVDIPSGEVELLTETPDSSELFPWILDDGTIIYTAGTTAYVGEAELGVFILRPDGSSAPLTGPSVVASNTSAREDLGVVFDGSVEGATGQPVGGLWRMPLEGGKPEFLGAGYHSPVVHPTRDGYVAISVASPGEPSVFTYIEVGRE